MTRSILLILLMFVPAVMEARSTDLHALYDSLAHARPDPRRRATVSELLVIRGGQEISLTSGTLRLLEPVRGRVFGAVFEGKGSMVYAPPTRVERAEFERQTGSSLVDGRIVYEFSKAVFWFESSFLADLGTGLRYDSVEASRSEEGAVERSLEYLAGSANENVFLRVITELLEPAPRPYLLADLFTGVTSRVFLEVNPRRTEEVRLLVPYELVPTSFHLLKTVNAFHTLDEYANASEFDLVKENRTRLRTDSVHTDVTFDAEGKLTGSARLVARRSDAGQRTERFLIDPLLTVDSMKTDLGTAVAFHQLKERYEVFVELPGEDSIPVAFTFYYHGTFFRRNRLSTYKSFLYHFSSSSSWYPTLPDIRYSAFDGTFRCPPSLMVVPAGRIVGRDSADGLSVVRSRTDGPALNFSFTYGSMEKDTMRLEPEEPLITYYSAYQEAKNGAGPQSMKNIAASYKLFSSIFGRPGLPALTVAPGPAGHGEAYDGMVQVTASEFMGTGNERVALDNAHEVAHLWWGLGVAPASYHDWWLGEAFAEYSALLYGPFVLNDQAPFFKKLGEYRRMILTTRKYILGSGPSVGSIWLGYRASSEKTRGDYALSTYAKGAWVLHMLRMMMIDLRTMNEDGFKQMMREYYEQYRGKVATTDDFRRVVEKYFRTDMRWFFDQWVYGTEIPTLECTKTTVKLPDGKVRLTITIEEKDVSGPFILSLPIEISFGGDDVRRARLYIDKEKKEFIYDLEKEPSKVTFNILDAVLCDLDT